MTAGPTTAGPRTAATPTMTARSTTAAPGPTTAAGRGRPRRPPSTAARPTMAARLTAAAGPTTAAPTTTATPTTAAARSCLSASASSWSWPRWPSGVAGHVWELLAVTAVCVALLGRRSARPGPCWRPNADALVSLEPRQPIEPHQPLQALPGSPATAGVHYHLHLDAGAIAELLADRNIAGRDPLS